MKFDKKTSKSIYRIIITTKPKSISESIVFALSHFRLSNKEEAWRILKDLKKLHPDNVDVRDTFLSLILLTGEYSDLFSIIELENKINDNYIQKIANFVATEYQLPSFVLSSPILLNYPKFYDKLLEAVLSEVSKASYNFKFKLAITRLLVLSDFDSGKIARFREAFEQNSDFILDKKSCRIYDMVQKLEMPMTNFSEVHFDYYDRNLDDLLKQIIELDDPLKDIDVWSPWVGAFTNFPTQPLHFYTSKLISFMLKTYPILQFTTLHPYQETSRQLPCPPPPKK